MRAFRIDLVTPGEITLVYLLLLVRWLPAEAGGHQAAPQGLLELRLQLRL